MTYHVLNGDALAHSFAAARIPGEVIVFREALIDGDITATALPEFWQARASYMKLGKDVYQAIVLSELEKIAAAKDGDEFNLWFEYDLFCQVNMWFVLSMLQELTQKIKVFAVYTSHLGRNDKYFWNGFGPAATAEDLRECFTKRIALKGSDVELGSTLWQAYRTNDLDQLTKLSKKGPPAFPFIETVIEAHTDTSRPERVINEILDEGVMGFENVFKIFWQRESVYGFGDVQLKNIYDKIMAARKKDKQ